MIKKIFGNKKGVTLLEGLIALTLLAMVTVGVFAVLVSSSRKSEGPDIHEEMALAVEKANKLLQGYVHQKNIAPSELPAHGLCGYSDETDPLSTGLHDITCLLPNICNRPSGGHDNTSNWFFKYQILPAAVYQLSSASSGKDQPRTLLSSTKDALSINSSDTEKSDGLTSLGPGMLEVNFSINCNGFSL